MCSERLPDCGHVHTQYRVAPQSSVPKSCEVIIEARGSSPLPYAEVGQLPRPVFAPLPRKIRCFQMYQVIWSLWSRG